MGNCVSGECIDAVATAVDQISQAATDGGSGVPNPASAANGIAFDTLQCGADLPGTDPEQMIPGTSIDYEAEKFKNQGDAIINELENFVNHTAHQPQSPLLPSPQTFGSQAAQIQHINQSLALAQGIKF